MSFSTWFKSRYTPSENVKGYWKDSAGKLLSPVAVQRLRIAWLAGFEEGKEVQRGFV